MPMEIDPVDILAQAMRQHMFGVIPDRRDSANGDDEGFTHHGDDRGRKSEFDAPSSPQAKIWNGLRAIGRRVLRDAIGLAIIVACLKAGTTVQTVFGEPIPGSILGMGLLLLLLAARVLPEKAVQGASADLLFILPALFVPLYVAPLSDGGFWRHVGISLLPAALGGAVLMLLVTGGVARRVVRR